jgi:membrane protease YdiL (CAAX protease family)
VETLIVQHWLIQMARKYLPLTNEWQKWLVAVVLSAMVFALGHTYSLFYMVAAFIAGLIFAGAYWLFAKRKDMNPVLAVFLLHFTNNLLNFVWAGTEFWLS